MCYRKHILILTLFFSLFLLVIFGTSWIHAEENKTAMNYSSISGVVKDSETGLMVENADIKLDYYVFNDKLEPVDSLEISTQTDAKGAFNFNELPSGHINEYDLYISHDSYFCELEWGGFNGSNDIYIESELNPEKYGTVSGTVTDLEGNPLANVKVICEWSPDTGCISGTTNSNGEYILENILFGNHTLEFLHILYETVYEEVNVEENKTTTIDAQLTNEREHSSISGVVKDSETGLTVENVAIKLDYNVFNDELEPIGSLEKPTKTDAKGAFNFNELPSGHINEYDLYISHDSYFCELKWGGFNGSVDKHLEIALKFKEVEEIRYGYVLDNHNITVADAIAVLRHIVGLSSLDEDQQKRAKVSTGDGDINVQDAIVILRYVVGLITELPVKY